MRIIDYFSLQLTRHFFGSLTTVPLIPNGGDTSITQVNKHHYVNAYVEYELVTSMKEQYEAFAEGFSRVCNTKSDIIVSIRLTIIYCNRFIIHINFTFIQRSSLF